VAATVHVTLVTGSAENRPPEVELVALEIWRFGHSALLPGDGIAHNEHIAHTVADEDRPWRQSSKVQRFLVL
jgi:hypothetical protein